jgi:hypothetical protein
MAEFCPIFVLPAKTRVKVGDEEAQGNALIASESKLFGAKVL